MLLNPLFLRVCPSTHGLFNESWLKFMNCAQTCTWYFKGAFFIILDHCLSPYSCLLYGNEQHGHSSKYLFSVPQYKESRMAKPADYLLNFAVEMRWQHQHQRHVDILIRKQLNCRTKEEHKSKNVPADVPLGKAHRGGSILNVCIAVYEYIKTCIRNVNKAQAKQFLFQRS